MKDLTYTCYKWLQHKPQLQKTTFYKDTENNPLTYVCFERGVVYYFSQAQDISVWQTYLGTHTCLYLEGSILLVIFSKVILGKYSYTTSFDTNINTDRLPNVYLTTLSPFIYCKITRGGRH